MVTRSALQNAASIAKNILTTEAIVAEAPEKAGAGAGMPRHGRHGRDDVTGREESRLRRSTFPGFLSKGPAKPALFLVRCHS